MKNRNITVVVLVSILCGGMASASLLDQIQNITKKTQPADHTIFVAGSVPEKRQELTKIKENLEEIKRTEQDFQSDIQSRLDKTNLAIANVKDVLKQPDALADVLNKKLTLLNEEAKILLDFQISRKDLISTLEKHADSLKAYIEDSDFKTGRVEHKSFYTFHDLQKNSKRIADQEENIAHLGEQKNTLVADLESKKREFQEVEKSYKKKLKEQEEFASRVRTLQKERVEDVIRHKGEILDAEKGRLATLLKFIELQIRIIEKKLASIESRLSIERLQLKLMKEDFQLIIKPSLRITTADVQAVESETAQKKQMAIQQTNTYLQDIKSLTVQRDKLRKELEKRIDRFKVSLADKRALDEWKIRPESVNSYLVLCHVGYINDRIMLLDRRIELKSAEVALENEHLRSDEIMVASVKTWQKIVHSLFSTDQDVMQEVKKYENYKTTLTRDIAAFVEKRTAVTGRLNVQNIALVNVQRLNDEMRGQQYKLFNEHAAQYTKCLTWLNDAKNLIFMQIDVNNKLTESYSLIINTMSATLKQMNALTEQLATFGIWKRSVHAISWQGIKNAIPDVGLFIEKLGELTSQVLSWSTITSVMGAVAHFLGDPIQVIELILYILFFLSIFFVLKFFLPRIKFLLLRISPKMVGVYTLSRIAALAIGFVVDHLIGIYSWMLILLSVLRLDTTEDVLLFLVIFFYIVSVPYVLYLSHRFVRYFMTFNEEHGYVILTPIFQHRFVKVFLIFCYVSAIILCIREIWLVINVVSYAKSELPTILLALYSIIFRVLLVLLIGKEEILSIIPTQTAFLQWISRQVSRYYYVLLAFVIGLMVLSDPYIGGYGNLISHSLWGLFLTILTLRVVFIFHQYVKKIISWIFFTHDGDVVKERFGQSKTWYGILLLIVSLINVLIYLAIFAWIWGYSIGLDGIRDFFTKELFSAGLGPDDKPIYISIFSFIKLFGLILSGFVLSSALNRFVFKRIFDLLLVESGIQNTITSISRYLIVISVIIIAFQSVGMTSILLSIGVIAAGVSWIVQDPIKDFASYFILLVQRPIKVGDYIFIDQETQGVVRQVSPRSVILRRKNSYNIIVPNSHVTGKAVLNWNYTRNFLAFDDILFTISYTEDPLRVRELVQKILDENADILKSPAPNIQLDDFVRDGYLFMVRAYISSVNTLRKWEIASDVRFKIAHVLAQEHIQLLAPVRVKMIDAKPSHSPEDNIS